MKRHLLIFLSRLRSLTAGRRLDAELDDEVRAHLELAADEYRRRGLPPREAELAARRDFGGVALTTERYREQRGFGWLDALAQDVRYALRMWRRAPGFGLVVVVVLALGIGVNSAMFTLVDALLFRPLSGRAADLLGVYSHDPARVNSYRLFSYPNYADIRDRNDVFDTLIAYSFSGAGMPAGDVTRRTFVELVSSNFFRALGVSLAAGRTFTDAEEQPGANVRVTIATYAAWERSGFDAGFLGRTVRVNAQDFTIVGVAPDGFSGTTALLAPELWLPMGVFDSVVTDSFKTSGGGLPDRANHTLSVAGILKPGMTAAQADARLAALSIGLERAFPAENRGQVLTVHTLSRVNLSSTPQSDAGPAAMSAVLMPLSGGVLLIACLNIANMLLARASARKKEIAVRLALGGSRGRIVRQLLTEGLLLATVGAAGGLLIGWWTTELFVASLTPITPVPLRFHARPDLNIVAATTVFGVLSVLAFGLAPALKISRPDVVDDLKDLGASRAGHRRLGTRAWLVVCQVAVSLMLMTAGGLFARGALHAAVADPGYRYDGLLLASIDPSLAGYTQVKGRATLAAALERVRALPGVAAASANSQVPFGDFHESREITRPGHTDPGRREPTYTLIAADYFKSVGLPILRGREFRRDEENVASRSPIAIVDEPLARRLFPDDDPLGQQIRIGAEGGAASPAQAQLATIVGIVPGIRDELTDREPLAHVYVPMAGPYRGPMHLHVRAASGSAAELLDAIRRELRAVDDRLPVVELRTMQAFHDRGLVLWVIRAAGRVLLGLGTLALVLAAIGVYGVKSYVVSQRTREIGIRLALGARPRDIAAMLLRDGARMTLVGVAIGFPLALLLVTFLSVAIFEVSAYDPIVLTLAPLVLVGAAALATYLPARRGMRVSPLDALRTE
jgi:predicted permease